VNVKRIAAVSLLALALVATGCDAFGDDVAARVDGRDITVSQVTALAKVLNRGQSVEKDGRLDGTQARRALTGLVQLAVARSALRDLGEEVTPADTTIAENQMQSFTDAPASVRKVLLSGFEATAALDRVIPQHWDTPLGRATLDEIAKRSATVPERLCIEGWIGAAASEAEALALVQGATSDPSQQLAALGFQPVGSTSTQFCQPVNQLDQLPDGLGAKFDLPASNTFQAVQYDDPQGGPVSVIFRPLGRQKSPARNSPDFQKFAEESVAAVLQQGGGLVGQVALQLADVDIDSRFGPGLDTNFIVKPPAAPPTTAPPTTAVPQPAQQPAG
jgi:hypothetical protein